ncbi:hypothetical protein AMTRI_Chr01g108930 [Amborella trichopoda]
MIFVIILLSLRLTIIIVSRRNILRSIVLGSFSSPLSDLGGLDRWELKVWGLSKKSTCKFFVNHYVLFYLARKIARIGSFVGNTRDSKGNYYLLKNGLNLYPFKKFVL